MSGLRKDDIALEAARAITLAVNGPRLHINGIFHAGGVPIHNVGGLITCGEIAIAALSHAGFKVVRADDVDE